MVRLAGGMYADSGSLAAIQEAPPAARWLRVRGASIWLRVAITVPICPRAPSAGASAPAAS
jgi:hypothetical protein